METVEVVVYITVAVILGGMIIAFVAGWDASKTFDGLKRLFTGDTTTAYEKITSDQLPARALSLWQACGLGSTALNKTVYVTDNATLTKTALFDAFKRSNVCKTIQSAEQGCGDKEDVSMADIQGPAIITLRCDPAAEQLVIS